MRNDRGHGVRLPADLAIGEPAEAIAVGVQRELARMVVLERLAAPVRGVAVGLDDQALLAPEEEVGEGPVGGGDCDALVAGRGRGCQ